MNIVWYILSGACSGVIAGMGMGGGTILIPVLTLLLNVSQHGAQGVNIIAFLPTAAAAIIVHKREGRIDFSECIPIICAGGLAAVCGALVSVHLSGDLLRRLYGAFLGVLCVIQFLSGEKAYKQAKK